MITRPGLYHDWADIIRRHEIPGCLRVMRVCRVNDELHHRMKKKVGRLLRRAEMYTRLGNQP